MKKPKVAPPIPEEAKPYLKYLNNTGGNTVEDLWHRYYTEDGLAFSNIVVFTMGATIESQVSLIVKLKREGLLK